MDWGITAALVLSAAALLISIKAAVGSKRARATAEKAAEVRQAGSADAAKPAGAVETVVTADVAGVAEPAEAAGKAEIAEPDEPAEVGAEPVEAAKSEVELDVRHVENDLYRLTNKGTAPAVNIVFDEDHLPAVFLLRSGDEVSLQRDEELEFVMAGSVDKPLASELLARWDGQAAPVALKVPSKG